MQILLNTKKEDLSRGSVNATQAVLTSITNAESVAFPVLNTTYNREQKFDFNVNWFGESGQKKHAVGEKSFTTVTVTPDFTGIKEQAEGIVEITEKDTDKTVAEKVFKAGGLIIVDIKTKK